MNRTLRRLMSIVLAMALLLSNVMPALAAGNTPVVVKEQKYTYEALDQAGIEESAKANSYQSGKTHPEWHDGPASWAFDGDTQTCWHSKYNADGTDERTEPKPPIAIEWSVGSTPVLVGKLGYFRKDGNNNNVNGRWKNIKVYGKNGENNSWKEIAFQNEAGAPNGANLTDAATNVEAVILFDQPTEVTHLKVEVTGTYHSGAAGVDTYVSAGEIKTYKAVPAESATVALDGKKFTNFTCSSAETNGGKEGPANLAFDGDPTTAWHTVYNSNQGQNPPHYIEWDLGDAYAVKKMTYQLKNGQNNGKWKTIKVEASLNGETKTVFEGNITIQNSKAEIAFNEEVWANHLKVTITATDGDVPNKFASAGEIVVYHNPNATKPDIPVTPSTPETDEHHVALPKDHIKNDDPNDNEAIYALGKPTHSSDTHVESIKNAIRAFDGDVNTACETTYQPGSNKILRWNLGRNQASGYQYKFTNYPVNRLVYETKPGQTDGIWKEVKITAYEGTTCHINNLDYYGRELESRRVVFDGNVNVVNGKAVIDFGPVWADRLELEFGQDTNGKYQAGAGEITVYYDPTVTERTHDYHAKLTQAEYTLNVGETMELKPLFSVWDGDVEIKYTNPSFYSEGEAVFKVARDMYGHPYMEAVAPGTATLRAETLTGSNIENQIWAKTTAQIKVIDKNAPVVAVKLNGGEELGGESLEAIVAKTDIAEDQITSLEFVSGKVTHADLVKANTLTNLETLKCNLNENLTFENKDGNASTEFPGWVFAGFNGGHAKLKTVELNGFTVIGAGDRGFTDCANLTSVTALDAVEIGPSAFSRCSKLTNVQIPNVEVISQWAFAYTPNLKLDLGKLTKLRFLGSHAFNDCGAVVNAEGAIEVTIPATVNKMQDVVFGKHAGEMGTDLVESKFQVTMLGNPPKVEGSYETASEGSYAFAIPSADSYIIVPKEAEDAYRKVDKYDNPAYDPEKDTWAGLHIGKPVTVNLTVKVNGGTPVGGASLADCVAQTNIPVDQITSLEFVSGKLTQEDLATVNTLNKVETFTLNVSDTMQLIGKDGNPTTVLGKDTATLDFVNTPAGWSKGALITLTLGGITEIQHNGIKSDSVETINLPDVITVGESALSSFKWLETLNLPKAKTIGRQAFYYDQRLSELNMGAVETIDAGAFLYTDALSDVTFPASLKSLNCLGFGLTQNGRKTAEIVMNGVTPPTVMERGQYGDKPCFDGVNGSSIVIVPNEALQAYLTAAYNDNPSSYGDLPDATKWIEHRHTRWHDLNLRAEGTYLVTYNTGNSWETRYAYVNQGAALTEAQIPTAEAPEGKTFVGWNTKRDGTGTMLDASFVPTENTTVYAVFEDAVNKVTATFVNGKETVATREVEQGKALGDLPAAPQAPANKVFKGWKDPNGTFVTAETLINEDTMYTAEFGPEELANRDVNFYVFVDGERVLAAHPTDVTTYWIDGRQCIDGATLEAAYGDFGFKAADLANSNGKFLHTDRGHNDIWNAGIKTLDGVAYAATINHKVDSNGAKGNEIDVYYMPKTSGDVGDYHTAINAQTFYTVKDATAEPAKVEGYFLNGTTAVVTKTNVDNKDWVCTGLDHTTVNGTVEGGKTTFTIDAIAQPYTLTQANAKATVTFVNGEETVETRQITLGEKLGKLPEAPTAPAGQEFVGWFDGENPVTAETPVTGNMTVTAKFQKETINVTVKFNGMESVGASSLEKAVAKAKLTEKQITSLEFVSGTVTQEDLAQLKNYSKMSELTMNLDGDLTVLNAAGKATTILAPGEAQIVYSDVEVAGSSHTPLKKLTLKGFTEIRQDALKKDTERGTRGKAGFTFIDLPDVVTVGDSALSNLPALETLNLPKAKTIGGSAFYSDKMLRNLDISSAKTFGYNAFGYTEELRNVTFSTDLTKLDNVGLGTGSSKKTVHVIMNAAVAPELVTTGWGAPGCFKGVNASSTVLIPNGSLDSYLPGMNMETSRKDITWGDGLSVRVQGTNLVKFNGQKTWEQAHAYVNVGETLKESQIPSFKAPEGMRIASWNTKKDGTGTKVDLTTKISELTKTSFGEQVPYTSVDVINLYPVFEKAAAKVTFQVEGQDDVTVEIEIGEEIGTNMPEAPAKPGYCFDKWVDADGNEVTAETVVAGDMTVTAQYVKEYTVTYADGVFGDVFANQEHKVAAGSKAPAYVGEPTREGYVFTGWLNYDTNKVEDPTEVTITADTTYVAQWEEVKKVTVTYADGVFGDVFANQEHKVAVGSKAPAYVGEPTREGYVFTGWLNYDTNKVEDPTEVTITADTTYVAQWEEIKKVTVTYADGVFGDVFANQEHKVAVGSKAPAYVGEPTREGYVFTGWLNYATNKVEDPTEVTITADTTYVAQWEEVKKVTVVYADGVFGDVFANQEHKVAVGSKAPAYGGTPVRAGYTFAGWLNYATNELEDPTEVTITTDTTYVAQWTENEKVTVVYADGVFGDVFVNQEHEVLSGSKAPAYNGIPTRAGYTFAGWLNYATNKVEDPTEVTITTDTTYVAQWKENEKILVVYADGVFGDVFVNQEHEVLSGSKAPAYNGIPTREGYVFTGWLNYNTNKVEDPTEVTITADTTYVAQWEEVKKVTVTYADGVFGDVFANQEHKVAVGSKAPAYGGTPVRAGYTFAGWLNYATNEVEDPTEATITADTTYVAQWKENEKVKVIFADGVFGDAFVNQEQEVPSGSKAPAYNGIPLRAGYTFAGWLNYATNEVEDPTEVTVTADTTYVAQWKENEKVMVVFADGVFGDVFVNQEHEVLSGSKAPAYNGIPTREGYVFTGWLNYATNEVEDPTEVTITADTTYVAQWEEVK